MKTDELNNGVASDANSFKSTTADPLQCESTAAYDAVMRQLQELLDRAREPHTLSNVVKSHPWRMTAVATGVGLGIGAWLARSGKRSRETIASELKPANGAPTLTEFQPRWWTSLIGPTLEVAKVFAERALLNALATHAARSEFQGLKPASPAASVSGDRDQ